MAKKNGAARVTRVLRREDRSLPVRLSEDEIREMSRKAAELSVQTQELESKEAALKADAAAEKKKAERVDLERRSLQRAIYQGSEERPVEVVTEADMRTGVVREIRTDTGEVLRERGITTEESQGVMFADLARGGTEDDEVDENEPIDITPRKALPAKRRASEDEEEAPRA